MQLHFSLSMDKTLYKEKRENDQSKHEINLTKIKGYFLFAGYVDKLKIDTCEIVSLLGSSAWNISLRLVSYIPARITNFENIWVVKNILAFNSKIRSSDLPVVNPLQMSPRRLVKKQG